MTSILQTKLVVSLTGGMLLAVVLLFSCGQQTGHEAATTAQQSIAAGAAATDTVPATRPAPAFFVVPPDMARQRVWLCENTASDIFHVKHDCPLLLACKGEGSFRNVSLLRAIEDYGRYNCQTCSKSLDSIFDEDMVREAYTP